ncbi:unnamed protein product, partial [Ranitomeya imitator]
TNGQTERTNQTLETYLRCFVSADQDDWVSFLPLAEFALNNRASSATLVSPFFCNSGFHPRFSSGQVESSDCPGVDSVVDRLQQIWTQVVDNLTLSQEKAQLFANRRRRVGPRLRVGDLVSSPKFKPRFIGPYRISEILNPVSFRLTLPDSFSIHNVFHRSLLRRYVAPMVPSVEPPAPVLVEGELEYIVEKILDSRVSRRKLQYLVKWKGYAQEDNSWVFASDVHAPDLVRAFHVAHPGRPGGSACLFVLLKALRRKGCTAVPLVRHGQQKKKDYRKKKQDFIDLSSSAARIKLDNRQLKATNTYQVPNTTLNYTLAADVALLSRNIKIIGEDYPGWYSESFGARVLVSTFSTNNVEYRGSARIENVEFYHTGQEGYRDPTDPRNSLAFLNLGEVPSNESYVKGCAFHNGFSPAIGVFYTNGLNIDDNVIHFTVGEGIRVWGERINIRRNLVALAVWPGTYQDREEVNNILWHAGIDISEGTDIVLQNNVVSGFERAGYRIDGEVCQSITDPSLQWFNNEAHGGLYGIYMNQDGLPDCSLIRGFKLWKCWDYGIYFQVTSSVQISDVFLAENGMGVLSIIYTPAATTHQISNKTVQISKSLLVGTSTDFDCSDVLTDSDANVKLSAQHRSARPLTGGRSGICWPNFVSGHNMAPAHPNAGTMSYNAISGLLTVKDTTFVGYKSVCSGQSNVMFMTNPDSEDLQHPVEVSTLAMSDCSESQKVFIHRPDVSRTLKKRHFDHFDAM